MFKRIKRFWQANQHLFIPTTFAICVAALCFYGIVYLFSHSSGKETSAARTAKFHQEFPLWRQDGELKLESREGYISEKPVALDQNFAVIRVQVLDDPNADYRSEMGAIISLNEKPQIGDKVMIVYYEIFNNPMEMYHYVRLAKKIN